MPAQGVPHTPVDARVERVKTAESRWRRLYMEPVEAGGSDIDQMEGETYRPDQTTT